MLGQYLGLNLSRLPYLPSCSLHPRNSSRFSLQKHCVKVWYGPVLSDHSREDLLISHHRPDCSGRFIGHGHQDDIGGPPCQ
jgi:hypothetical protein